MTYDANTLKKDLVYSSIKITRTNVETKGYTGFLLPLLENNTYSIVIDYSTMHTVKKGWIDDALQVLSVPQTVYACDTYKKNHFLHRGILVRTWIMSGYPIMNPKALVNFPSLTNETMSYFRSQIRYVDYVSDVCCPCTIVY